MITYEIYFSRQSCLAATASHQPGLCLSTLNIHVLEVFPILSARGQLSGANSVVTHSSGFSVEALDAAGHNGGNQFRPHAHVSDYSLYQQAQHRSRPINSESLMGRYGYRKRVVWITSRLVVTFSLSHTVSLLPRTPQTPPGFSVPGHVTHTHTHTERRWIIIVDPERWTLRHKNIFHIQIIPTTHPAAVQIARITDVGVVVVVVIAVDANIVSQRASSLQSVGK